ncbi:hypothetical protein M407DRAFT_244607, partial [Tulasnella calospora MUT 4182]
MRFTYLLSFALSALVVSALPVAIPDDIVPVTDTTTDGSDVSVAVAPGNIAKPWV